ncbi:CAP-associated domain-containing protein [Carnobacterium funditum]|uniref:CAP-associated domain-containing protein n=1 Tax=Carnobacterium funditum TaxID=2752 RepID=UPI0005584804|nr:CAP-associated domain-containing protein [Carnobacterium funditum]
MKTILRTIPIFLVLMILIYFIPQIISDSPSGIITQKKNTTELKKETQIGPIPAVKQETFPLTGMGHYMGEPIDTFKKKFGEPLRIESNIFGDEWWIYGDNENDYYQVAVSEEDTITSIFVLGSTLDVLPFKVGMDITEVYQLATLYPTFSFDYKKTNYIIELSENDLNYHPLVIFEKNIFAILMVDRETNKINAIRYVDEPTLLQSDIYEVIPENEVITKKTPKTDLENRYDGNVQEVEMTINMLRQRYGLSELTYSKQLSSMADDIFINQSKSVSEQSSEEKNGGNSFQTESSIKIDTSNKNESIQKGLAEHEDEEGFEHTPLTSKQIHDYLEMNKISLADTRVVYSNKFTDPTWLITYWFSLENQRTILTDPLMKRFGFAFRNEEVMLILDTEVEHTKKTGANIK